MRLRKFRKKKIGGERLNACQWCPPRNWKWDFPSKPDSADFRNTEEVGLWGNDSNHPSVSIVHSQRDRFLPKPLQVYKYDQVPTNFNEYTSRRPFSGLSRSQNIRQWLYKIWRKFLEIDVIEIRTSLKDDVEDGYNLDGHEISNLADTVNTNLC